MKISVFYDHILRAAEQSGESIPELIAKLCHAGIEYTDVPNELISKESETVFLLKESEMKISSSYEFYDWGKDEYGDETRLREQIDNAVRHGFSSVLVVPGFLDDGEAKEFNEILDRVGIPDNADALPEELDLFMKSNKKVVRMTRMLRRAVFYGKSKGVTVTLEDFDNYKAPYSRIMGLLWFMKNVDGLKFTFDTGNFIYSDELMEDAFDLLKDYIVHVHCKDRAIEKDVTGFRNKKGLAPCAVGEGYIPIICYAKKLLEDGYDGIFAVEHFGVREYEKAMLASAENLKNAEK